MTAPRMIDRFTGSAGRVSLIEVLLEQRLILGKEDLAIRFAEVGELVQIETDREFITQGDQDSDVYFIITGAVDVRVHDRTVAARGPQDHVGEMSALVPTATRSATVVATEPTLALKVSAQDFKAAADNHPSVWRHVTKQLVERLTQRNQHVRPSHEAALVFIICSTEALPVAREIQNQFQHDKFFVKIWTEGTFKASQYALDSLEEQLDESDFAIAIVTPDDLVESRGEEQGAPRDNVIFELGLFVGRLGRPRSFLVEPRGDEVRLPSDLKGITTIGYSTRSTQELASRLGPACNQMREIFNELGPK